MPTSRVQLTFRKLIVYGAWVQLWPSGLQAGRLAYRQILASMRVLWNAIGMTWFSKISWKYFWEVNDLDQITARSVRASKKRHLKHYWATTKSHLRNHICLTVSFCWSSPNRSSPISVDLKPTLKQVCLPVIQIPIPMFSRKRKSKTFCGMFFNQSGFFKPSFYRFGTI